LVITVILYYSKLFYEFIELKNNINMEVIFKEKREKKNKNRVLEFLNFVLGKYMKIVPLIVAYPVHINISM